MGYTLRLATAVALALSACAADGDDDTSTEADLCGAAAYEALIGQNIAAITLPSDLNHRIIMPDTLVTMDYSAERLNFYTDEDGVIERIACG